MNFLKKLFSFSHEKETAHKLYRVIVEQARQPVFYQDLGVTDSQEGHFDMITLHVALVMRRLRQNVDISRKLSQALFDYMFADIDMNLREQGIGDMGVLRRVKKMAKAFYGRLESYDGGLMQEDDADLIQALHRNLYRERETGQENLAKMATYVRNESAHLDGLDINSLMKGELSFEPFPQQGRG